MSQKPPPLPGAAPARVQKKKKKKGCLVGLGVIAVLLFIGVIPNSTPQKEWEKDREELLPDMEAALGEGNYDKVLRLANPYMAVGDPELEEIVAEANRLAKAEREKRQEERRKVAQEEWKEKREVLLPDMEAALDDGDYGKVLRLSSPYTLVADPELDEIVAEANQLAKAERVKRQEEGRKAALAQKKAGEATRSPSQRLREKLHRDLGSGEGLFGGGEKKWENLREVECYPSNGVVTIEYKAGDYTNKTFEFDTISKVLDSAFKVKESKHVKIQVVDDYMDSYGNKKVLPWINVRLNRSEYEKANMKNLRDHEKVERFLRSAGEVVLRGGDDS